MNWLGQLGKLASALFGPMLSKSKRMAQQRAAVERPTALVDHADNILNGALRRLGTLQTSDPWWSQLLVAGEATLVRPEEFHKPHIRVWLSQPEVIRILKDRARARTVGASGSASDYENLVASHMAASLEDRQHAESAVVVAIAFLQASLQGGTADAGTVGVVQALSGEQNRRFDAVDQKLDRLSQSAAASSSGTAVAGGTSLLESLAVPMRRWESESTPPAALLRAEFCIVPFIGRTAELEHVQNWLMQSTSVALALITGPGGRGKTRLAIEAATRAASEGWQGGFIAEDRLSALLAAWVTEDNLLLVVDYAEDDPTHLVEALQVVRKAALRPPLRAGGRSAAIRPAGGGLRVREGRLSLWRGCMDIQFTPAWSRRKRHVSPPALAAAARWREI